MNQIWIPGKKRILIFLMTVIVVNAAISYSGMIEAHAQAEGTVNIAADTNDTVTMDSAAKILAVNDPAESMKIIWILLGIMAVVVIGGMVIDMRIEKDTKGEK